MKIVEGGSFVAAPSCGLYLAQFGADVIRFDTIGGGPDFRRWPQSPDGVSLYWEGLNKGKKSIAVDLSSAQGRELVSDLIAAPGADRGIFLTNYPAQGFLSYERLRERRADLILVRVMGHADGTPAVDYTINSAVGLPFMTGPESLGDVPVNHSLPAWDLLTGAYAGMALLTAERHRRETGEGQEVRVPLSDVAIASLGNLGQIAEVSIGGADRKRYGNDLFGAFGRDFETRDRRRIMVIAITAGQWKSLVGVLGIAAQVAALERRTGRSFAEDEGERFKCRAEPNAIVGEAVAQCDYQSLTKKFADGGVCWGPYNTLGEALRTDLKFSPANPMLSAVEHASGHTYLTPGSAGSFSSGERMPSVRAPRLGEHTDEILAEGWGLSSGQFGILHERGIGAGGAQGCLLVAVF
ncbi:MAG: CoA transferase, partial [Pseudorhodoplanes sp.]